MSKPVATTPYTYRQAFSNGEPRGYVVQHGTANPLIDIEDEELARRVTACLNACQGLSTEALEEGLVSNLVAACGGVNWLRLNRDNYGTPDWLEFFDAAAEDAGDAYRQAAESDQQDEDGNDRCNARSPRRTMRCRLSHGHSGRHQSEDGVYFETTA